MKRQICAACVKGATHARNDLPLQDSKRVEKVSDKITIISVADGHGSDKCPRSARGSAIAVNSFCKVVNRYLQGYGSDKVGTANLISFLNREGEMKFAQDICTEWQSRVRQSFYKNRDESCIDAYGNIDWAKVYTLYGTTLLGMLITDTFVFSFQIGDGDIVFVTDKEMYPLVEPEKFLGTETHSLSKENAWRKSVSSLRRKKANENLPYMYMLSTDGFVNSHESDEDYRKTCVDYFNMMNEYGENVINENLEKWLTETSELGCGDDITVVMAHFS